MSVLCIWVFRVFVLLYILALAIWLIGTFGWFGVNRDPVSGVFLVILGQPWTMLIDRLPENAWPILSALAPAINACLIFAICRVIRAL